MPAEVQAPNGYRPCSYCFIKRSVRLCRTRPVQVPAANCLLGPQTCRHPSLPDCAQEPGPHSFAMASAYQAPVIEIGSDSPLDSAPEFGGG
jgi:hypothetical protein